jgi:tetratricopeptide (TPR) repeat protein
MGAVIDFQRRLSSSHRILGKLDEARDVVQSAVDAARSLGDDSRLIESLSALAMVYVPRAEYDRTVAIADEALRRSEQAGDQHHQSIVHSVLGAAYLHRGEYGRASKSLERAIAMQRSLGDQRGLASSLNFSGLAYHRLAQFSRSIKHHEESLRIKRAIQDVSAIPGGLNALGDVLRDIGQLDSAIKNHTESLAMARFNANRGAECDNLRDLGVDYLLVGDLNTSEQHLAQVLRLSHEHKYPWYETRARSTWSEVLLSRGDGIAADQQSALALEMARRINATELLAEALLIRARTVALSGTDLASAIGLITEGIALAEAGDLILPLRMMYHMLAQLRRSKGDRAGAQQAQAKAQLLLQDAASGIEDRAVRGTFLSSQLAQAILSSQT